MSNEDRDATVAPDEAVATAGAPAASGGDVAASGGFARKKANHFSKSTQAKVRLPQDIEREKETSMHCC